MLFNGHHRSASTATGGTPILPACDHLSPGDSASLPNRCLSPQTHNGSRSVFLGGSEGFREDRAGDALCHQVWDIPPALPAALSQVSGSRACIFNGFILAGWRLSKAWRCRRTWARPGDGYLCTERSNLPKQVFFRSSDTNHQMQQEVGTGAGAGKRGQGQVCFFSSTFAQALPLPGMLSSL